MESPDSKLDARLRAVPLPEGLIQRLRQTALADDDGLDAALGELPLPAGLVERLRSIPLADDEDFDNTLRDVPVPAGLVTRLRSIPWADDDGLDAAIREVPVPARLSAPWKRRAARQKRLVRMIQVAAAASILLAVAGLFFGSRLANLVATGGADPDGQPTPSPATGTIVKVPPPAGHQLTSSIAADDPARTTAPSWHADVPKIGLSPSDRDLARGNPADVGPAVPSNVNPLEEINRWPLAYEGDEARPQARVEGLVPRGMDWPSWPGANIAFLMKNHVHPFVSPAADRHLESTVVPLGVDGQSYELTKRYLENKELPPPQLVRTEDFLAAVDYGFTPPAHEALELSLTAGPSPFGGEGLCLLQVGVQAGHVPPQQRGPVHLVLAIDTSANMRWNGCLDMVRRALKDLAGQLDAGDRLSLVACGDAARVVIEDIGPGEVNQFVAAVGSLTARGANNLPEGLSKAYDLARQQSASGRPAVRVVLVTDSMVELAPDSVAHGAAVGRSGRARHAPARRRFEPAEGSRSAVAEVRRGRPRRRPHGRQRRPGPLGAAGSDDRAVAVGRPRCPTPRHLQSQGGVGIPLAGPRGHAPGRPAARTSAGRFPQRPIGDRAVRNPPGAGSRRRDRHRGPDLVRRRSAAAGGAAARAAARRAVPVCRHVRPIRRFAAGGRAVGPNRRSAAEIALRADAADGRGPGPRLGCGHAGR